MCTKVPHFSGVSGVPSDLTPDLPHELRKIPDHTTGLGSEQTTTPH